MVWPFHLLINKIAAAKLTKESINLGELIMAPYSKENFRKSRLAQYGYFKHILQYSMLGIALTLVFLMLMLRFAWS